MFFDRLTLDKPRRTSDGYMVVRAKAARSGVYQYAGSEVDPDNKHGLRDRSQVNVLRDEATVFDKKAVHSFIGKPVTVDHPRETVTADNWKDHASGVIMGALKDGEHLSFDLLLTDKAAIEAVDSGKRELSNGYAAELEFGDFKANDGTECQARQTSIRGNHVAIVDRGRAGSECRIADAARCTSLPADVFELLTDERTYNGSGTSDKTVRDNGDHGMATKTITFDGMPIEVTDQAESAIRKLEGQLADANKAKGAAETKVAELTTDKAKLETDKAELETKLKDAEVTPAKLRDAAKSYANVLAKAKALGVEVTDEMDEAAIKKAAVSAKLGDDAKDWNDEQIAVSFVSLTKDVKVEQKPDALRDTIASQPRNVATDNAAVRDAARSMQYS